MIHISDAAQAHLSKLLKSQEKGTQIRIFVLNPGTFDAECGIAYCSPDSVSKNDTALRFKELIAYVDDLSKPYLEDAEIDFITDRLSSQLTMRAPNARLREISDDAPITERIKYFLQFRINPQLANHGGYVSLVSITDDNHVILKFGGGCNGCSMINLTLKESIEKQLLREFPKIRGVKDFTKHRKGKHSYY